MTDGPQPPAEYRSRRTFSEPSGKGEVSLADRAQTWRMLAWSPVGALLGFIFGARANYGGFGGPLFIVFTTVVGWALVFFLPLLATRVGGSFITSIYNPRGSRVPPKKEYSQAESLVARGMYRDAIAAFEVAASEDPEIPEPYLRVARIYRDHLQEHDNAARWFKRARRDAEMSEGMKLLVTRELVELYITKMGTPGKALPELARLAELQAGTPEGAWAAGELARLKHGAAEDDEASGSDG